MKMQQDSMDNAYKKDDSMYAEVQNGLSPQATYATILDKFTSQPIKPSTFWKYQEDKTLREIEEYLATTYRSHYTSETSKTQTLDLIESIGDAEPFSRSNAIKYLSRFGRKNGKSRLDLLKAIHYCILLYHFSGLHQNKTDEYKTF